MESQFYILQMDSYRVELDLSKHVTKSVNWLKPTHYSQSEKSFPCYNWYKNSYSPYIVTFFKHVLFIVGSLTYAHNTNMLKNMYYLPNLSSIEHLSLQ